MVTVVLLGTGTPNPDPARAGSAVAVTDGDRWVLVDCGRAATHRILEAGLRARTVSMRCSSPITIPTTSAILRPWPLLGGWMGPARR